MFSSRDLSSVVKTTGYAFCDINDGTGAELSAAVDTNNARKIRIYSVLHDKGVAGTLDTKLTECDTSGGSYTDVDGGAVAQQIANGVSELDCTITKRFVKVSCTAGTNGITAVAFISITGSFVNPNPL